MFKGVNWRGVLIATVVVFALGYVWYNVVFSELWHRLEPNAPVTAALDAKLLGGIATIAVSVIGLAWVFARMGVTRMADGLKTTLVIWVAFDATVYMGSYFFNNAPLNTMLFYSASDLVTFLVTAVILVLIRAKAA